MSLACVGSTPSTAKALLFFSLIRTLCHAKANGQKTIQRMWDYREACTLGPRPGQLRGEGRRRRDGRRVLPSILSTPRHHNQHINIYYMCWNVEKAVEKESRRYRAVAEAMTPSSFQIAQV